VAAHRRRVVGLRLVVGQPRLGGGDLTVEVGELLGVYDRILRDADERIRYHYVLIDFLCHRIAGEPQGAGDAAEARWFTRGEVGQLSLAQDTADVIKLGFEKSGSSL